ncbi:hypothetical protein [Sphingomonas sp. PWP1-2]|uniref:hypothetical protein n=1 Tax=Sphingomonas sp. PWP1-2 TaxID=2804558 RepID=UPI003CE6830A
MVDVFATRDLDLVNSFANDPDILPFCGFPAGIKRVDMRDRIDNPALLFVTDGSGAMICFDHTAEGWEFHSMFRRSCRGRKSITAALAMFDWLTSATGARVLLGTCPVNNLPVRWFCRQLGMASLGISNSDQFGPVERFRKELACR